MDLNFLFNQHLKTVGLFLNKKLPDEDFKTFKFLTRQLQESIANSLSNKTTLEETKEFIRTCSYGGNNEQER